jgi:hypothetical protein
VERATLMEVVKKRKGPSQKVRRALILLKADVDGPAWSDAKIAEAVGCRTQTVENLRERLVTLGFDITVNGKAREQPPRSKLLSGEHEAKVIATHLPPPPTGFANWGLRPLAGQVVELEIVPSISHETVRQTLKNLNRSALIPSREVSSGLPDATSNSCCARGPDTPRSIRPKRATPLFSAVEARHTS